MRNAFMTLTTVGPLPQADEGEIAMQMDEETFRGFYDATSRSVWLYLLRVTHDTHLADDLLQETYYRFLRTERSYDSEAHRRNYLFRIATNLVHDHRRKPFMEVPAAVIPEVPDAAAAAQAAERAARRLDLHRALKHLKPRERSMLWLAYAQGWSHEEIAAAVGVKTASLKAMLHRARQRLVKALDTGGRS